MSKLIEGDIISPFTAKILTDPTDITTEKDFTEKDLIGKWSVIYFYPKDMTPGCTTEACEFRDAYKFFLDNGYNLFGVSTDSTKSHVKFSQKHELPFTLIADESKSIVKAFDVYREKSMFGKKYMGIERTTFIVDPHGKAAAKWEKVKPNGHTAEVIAKLKDLVS